MTDTTAKQLPSDSRHLIASLPHTAGLVLIQAAVAMGGAYMQHQSTTASSPVPQHRGTVLLYVSLIAMEWALVRYVWAGVRKNNEGGLFGLIGGRWESWPRLLIDVAVALPFWVVWEATGRVMQSLLGPSHLEAVNALLPQSPIEILLWIALSVSAGICEEIVFRGYLQKQIQALTGSLVAAVLTQALLFGAGHAYQGMKQVAVITVLGVLYGVLAAWRGTLRPGMLAHAWSDINSGYLKFF
jgi:membrane protease YdiL (CAAX protease family)